MPAPTATMPADDSLPLSDAISDNEARSLSDEIIGIRRHLHKHPELGFEEHETAAFLRTFLEERNIEVVGPLAETGQYVDIEGTAGRSEGGNSQRHHTLGVGYRADIDALPTQDAKDVPYASTRTDVAHLCGHDAHAAMAVGVILLLDRVKDRLPGTVRVFFQPSEETIPSGAPAMVRDGVLDGLGAVYASHVDPHLQSGCYGLISGPATASMDLFDVHVRADSTGHSARPHEAKDTVWIAQQIMQAYYQLSGRITDSRHPSVITICRLRGGDAYNVIPAEMNFGGTLRCTHEAEREQLQEALQQIARHTAALYGAEASVSFTYGAPPVNNDDRLIAHLAQIIRKRRGEEAVYHIPEPSMGGEDFAHYLEHVPGALLRVGTRTGRPTGFPLHDANFDLDESVLFPTAQLIADVLITHLEKEIGADQQIGVAEPSTDVGAV